MKTIFNIIGGGAIAKNTKLQVFMTPQMYLETIKEAEAYGIKAKTDSELINKICSFLVNQVPVINLENQQLKAAVRQKNEIIDQLERKLEDKKRGKK